MRMPKPSARLVGLPVPPMADFDAMQRWRKLDEKIRAHQVARLVALKPSREQRRVYLENMDRHHLPAFMARMRRLVKYYWRQARRQSTEENPAR